MQMISQLTKKIRPGNGIYAPPPEETKEAQPVSIKDIDTSHHPKVKEAVEAAYEWVERKKSQPNASLVLVARQVYQAHGTPDQNRTGYGCGKTHIAKAVMWSERVVTDNGRVVGHCGQFYLAEDLINRLRPGDKGDTPAALAPMPKKLHTGGIVGIRTNVVVIDDVGTEGVLEYVSKEAQEDERQVRYFRFIDYCCTAGVSVVITANMSLDQLARHMGGRCWSRLLEMAPAGFMVDMTGSPDYRRRTSGR